MPIAWSLFTPTIDLTWGIIWRDQVFVDTQLSFGMVSAPAIFAALAEALEWIMCSRGVHNIIHYLDDYLIRGTPRSSSGPR